MDGPEVAWALGALGLDARASAPLSGSMSGSRVHRVALGHRDAVLKVTRAEDGREALDAARRELGVYTTLAADLPVRTPQLLDHLRTDDAVVLLLGAHSPPVPAADWGRARWAALARDLAALHDHGPRDGLPWRSGAWVLDSLREPDVDAALAFWSDRDGVLEAVLTDTGALAQAVTAVAPCFLHGDCHAANLLQGGDGPGSLVWVDWQAAGVGSPAVDLAFPSVRGVPDGAVGAHHEMLVEYAALRGLDSDDVVTAAVAAELAAFLFTWPRYARYNSEAAVERARRRVTALARTWNAR